MLPFTKIEYSLFRQPVDSLVHPFAAPFLKSEQINLPSQWHEWRVLSQEVGEVNKYGVFYAKSKLDKTKVEVWDTRNEGEVSVER